MSKEMVEAFATLEKEKGIKQEIIVDAIKAALVAAYKKNYNQAQNVEVVFDEKKGNCGYGVCNRFCCFVCNNRVLWSY